ncbi:MAG: HlyC/CorC family transporter [Deltaproteobacteria bacterium]|nr:HlyC/CorC family transporter [Deltaproteobacteria bacterium]
MRLSNPNSYILSALILLMIFVNAALACGADSANVSIIESKKTDVVLLIVFVLLALIFSFVCSLAEAVLLSITPSYIESLRKKQPKRAALLKRLRQERIDQSLAAILTLNTIAHTVGAIVAGAKATVVFGSVWIGLFSAFMTLMILFFSEIIPKTMGAVYWTRLVGVTALFVRGLIISLYPLVWVAEGLTRLLARGKVEHVFSRDEFIAMADIGKQAGHIDEHESRIIRNLFRFGSLRVTDIMTPRVVISAFPLDMTVAEALLHSQSLSQFSRLPVYETDIDKITGFVLKDDILMCKTKGQGDMKIDALKRDILFVPESMTLSILSELLLDHRQHIAIVVGEYGGTSGLVTLEDVLETLLGMEIQDEMDDVEDMRVMARQQWEKRAKAQGIKVGIIENTQAEKNTP